MRSRFAAIAAVSVAVLLSGCSTPAAEPTAGSDASSSPSLSGALTVYAAASLTDVFETIAQGFEEENPGVDVTFNFAGSSDLVAQLSEGAPADVFASADEKNMIAAADGGLLDGDDELFASNTLEIAVPAGNAARIASLADLARPDLRVVVCAPQVPCGAATQKVVEAAGVALTPVSEESSVTDVLAKVASGEADAGLVYVTDIARADGDVEGVPFDESSAAVNRYPIATLAGSADPGLARAFADYVLGAAGQAALADAGFGAP
ncbi:MAG: molybdate ABC transporter substrate-binding protein [Naasia sp.]